MTLEENKKITLAIIEEYSPNSNYLTDDTDIAERINFIYATDYQELSQNKKILKTKTLRDINGSTNESYTEMSLPSDLYQLKKVIALDENNNNVSTDYKVIGKKIYLSEKIDAKYIMEYYAFPTIIDEKTPNDFELELEQDACMLLPWLVANDILKVDPSSDYSSFLAEYQRRVQSWDTRKETPSVVIEEGIL